MIQQPPVALIVEAAAAAAGVKPADLRNSCRRSAELVLARKVVYLLAMEMTGRSSPQIGREMGDLDHTSVLIGFRSAKALYETNQDFRELVDGTRAGIEMLMAASAAELVSGHFAAQAPTAVARDVVKDPRVALSLRVSARDVRAMAVRLVALERAGERTLRLFRLIDEICTGDIDPVRRRDLARETRQLIATLTAELTDLDIQETDNGQEEQDRSGEYPRAAE